MAWREPVKPRRLTVGAPAAPAPPCPQVRKAFTADVAPGHTLIVADYGQLELRLLAHMANCRSMLEAFELGGDFHSRCVLGALLALQLVQAQPTALF